MLRIDSTTELFRNMGFYKTQAAPVRHRRALYRSLGR